SCAPRHGGRANRAGDPVEGEVADRVELDQSGHLLISVQHFGRMRQLPPGRIRPEDPGSTATIDGSIAHDAAIADTAAVEQRLAALAALAKNAAAAGSDVVHPRIDRRGQRGVGTDDQRHARAERQWTCEKDLLAALALQDDGLTLRAAIHGSLDTI